MEFWGPLALIGSTGALLAVPGIPAVYELWKRNDAAPLPTSRHDGRITNFAEAFRSRLAPLRPQLEQCRGKRELLRTSVEGIQVLIVGTDNFAFSPALMNGVAAVMCGETVCIPSERVVEADVYTAGSLDVGDRAALRAAYVTGDVTVGRDSTILRWLHSEGYVRVQSGAACYGRLSADRMLRLESQVLFQRLHALQILTLDPDSSDWVLEAGENDAPSADIPDQPGPQRIRAHGDFAVPAGESLYADVIATGELRFGHNARFFGSAKSHRNTVIEDGACLHGSLVSGGDILIGQSCLIAGPLMAENDVIIGRGTRIGRLDALTTIAARHVTIAPACQLHGSICARVQGTVQG